MSSAYIPSLSESRNSLLAASSRSSFSRMRCWWSSSSSSFFLYSTNLVFAASESVIANRQNDIYIFRSTSLDWSRTEPYFAYAHDLGINNSSELCKLLVTVYQILQYRSMYIKTTAKWTMTIVLDDTVVAPRQKQLTVVTTTLTVILLAPLASWAKYWYESDLQLNMNCHIFDGSERTYSSACLPSWRSFCFFCESAIEALTNSLLSASTHSLTCMHYRVMNVNLLVSGSDPQA